MSFASQLKMGVNPDDISEEEKYYMLLHQIKNIDNVSEESVAAILFEVMSYTGSWVSISELKKLLHEKDFYEIESYVIKKIRTRYGRALKDQPETAMQIEQEIIPQDLKETFFTIAKDQQGYVLKEAPYGLETYAFDAQKIQVGNFKKVVEVAMQKHLECGAFYDRGTIKAQWIQDVLKNTINCLSKNKAKDKVEINTKSSLTP